MIPRSSVGARVAPVCATSQIRPSRSVKTVPRPRESARESVHSSALAGGNRDGGAERVCHGRRFREEPADWLAVCESEQLMLLPLPGRAAQGPSGKRVGLVPGRRAAAWAANRWQS